MQRGGRLQEGEKRLFSLGAGKTPYLFRLYVAGSNLKSTHAIQIVQDLCAFFPKDRCKLEVIDLYQQPDLARQDNIIGIPTLVKVQPPPRRSFVGMIDDVRQILHRLGIPIVKYVRNENNKRG